MRCVAEKKPFWYIHFGSPYIHFSSTFILLYQSQQNTTNHMCVLLTNKITVKLLRICVLASTDSAVVELWIIVQEQWSGWMKKWCSHHDASTISSSFPRAGACRTQAKLSVRGIRSWKTNCHTTEVICRCVFAPCSSVLCDSGVACGLSTRHCTHYCRSIEFRL